MIISMMINLVKKNQSIQISQIIKINLTNHIARISQISRINKTAPTKNRHLKKVRLLRNTNHRQKNTNRLKKSMNK